MASPAKSPKKSPKKPKASSKASKETEDPTPALQERPIRERKAPVIYEEAPAEVKPFTIEDGSGRALGEIPNVAAMLKKTSGDEKVLEVAHRLCFKRGGTAHSRKTNLRKFSGLNDASEQVADRVERLPLPQIRKVAALFDCTPEKGSTKDDFVDTLAKWLVKPKSSGKPLPGSKRARSSGKGSKKKSKKAGGPKRPLTPYFLFGQARRSAIMKKHPNWGVTEVAQRLSKEWKQLDDDDKKPFEKAYKKARAQWEVDYAVWEKKQKKKKAAKSSSDDDDDDDDDDDESSEDEAPARKKRKVPTKDDSDKDDDDDDDDKDKKKKKDMDEDE